MPDLSELPWIVGALGDAGMELAAGAVLSAASRGAREVLRKDDLSAWLGHEVSEFRKELLQAGEFEDLRRALDEEDTWKRLSERTADALADRLAECFDPKRPPAARQAGGLFVARCLFESTLHFAATPAWAKIMNARLSRTQAEAGRAVDALVGVQAQLLQLPHLGATLDQIHARLHQIAGQLGQEAPATRVDLEVYLRVRVADWDRSTWLAGLPAPSRLERRLVLRDRGAGGGEMSEDAALVGPRMLVLVGRPGAGKTWLARRYARQAAIAALAQIEAGADLADVEIPILTTWQEWVKATSLGDDPRTRLVAASFADDSGHSDLGGGNITTRVRRFLTQPGRRVRLVVDSLDEATNDENQANRVQVLTSLAGWQVIVTSRPAAWDSVLGRSVAPSPEVRILELGDFDRDRDVGPFVQTWFAEDLHRGAALLDQIDKSPDLRRAAVVPLMLTFLCLITETAQDPSAPLPTSRRELFNSLVARLLEGEWVNTPYGAHTRPDVDVCLPLLAEWAWLAVEERNTAAGLGDWRDDPFTPPRIPPALTLKPSELRALDNVAPHAGRSWKMRRFAHRTLLEHFVAEQIAAFDAQRAASILLPHLWYDADWQVSAPAAIAAHNRRERGVLLNLLLPAIVHPTADLARWEASRELDRVLLAVAVESKPAEWTASHQALINDARERCADAGAGPRDVDFGLVAASAHWSESNPAVRAAYLADLPGLRSQGFETFRVLDPTTSERAEARARLLAHMSRYDPQGGGYLVIFPDQWTVPRLVRALTALDPSEPERAQARTVIMSLLPNYTAKSARGLVEALIALNPTESERAQARATLLAALPAANPDDVETLVRSMLTLSPTESERQPTRRDVGAAMLKPGPWTIPAQITVFHLLVTSEAERAQQRAALLNLSPTSIAQDVEAWVRIFSALGPTDSERAQARAAALNTLRSADPRHVKALVEAVVTLGPTDSERAQARAAALGALPDADADAVEKLVALVTALDPTLAERALARAELLSVLDPHGRGAGRLLRSQALPDEIAALMALAPTAGECARVRGFVMEALSEARPRQVERLVTALVALSPSEVERAPLRDALLAAMPSAYPNEEEAREARDSAFFGRAAAECLGTGGARGRVAGFWCLPRLVTALVALSPSDAERARARAFVVAVLATCDSGAVYRLVTALVALGPSEAERAQARDRLLAALPVCDPGDMYSLVRALVALSASEAERAHARRTVVAALPRSEPRDVEGLVAALDVLSHSEAERAQARDGVLAALPNLQALGTLVAAIRAFSTSHWWLEWLVTE